MNLDDIEKRALRGLELAQRIDRAGKLYQPPWTVGHPWSEDDGVVTVLVDGGSLFGDCCIGNMENPDDCHAADFIAASRVQWPQSCADVLVLSTRLRLAEACLERLKTELEEAHASIYDLRRFPIVITAPSQDP